MNPAHKGLSVFVLALSALPACSSASDAGVDENGAPIAVSPNPQPLCPLATCFFVTNTNDSGAGSLRQAIIDANAHGGPARIQFAIPGNWVQVIRPVLPLPSLQGGITIDGYSQTGAARATDTAPPVLKIVLDGALCTGFWGLSLNADGNVVTGVVVNNFVPGSGINVNGNGNTIKGNFLGVDVTGTMAVPNAQAGVNLNIGTGNTVGGPDIDDRNVLSGNGVQGALVFTDANIVENNAIGTSFDGTLALGNGGPGVEVHGDGNRIGGTEGDYGNIIAYNEGDGVWVPDGAGNTISWNSVFENGGLGIDLDSDGVEANDGAGDLDVGANGLQNFPRLQSATRDALNKVTMDWLLRSTPNTLVRVEFYRNPACDASGHGEGSTFVGSRAIRTDATGFVQNVWILPGVVPAGEFVSALATSLTDGSTSEFSPCLQIL